MILQGAILPTKKNEIGRFPVRRILLLLLAVVLLPLAVRAQNTTSSLTGTVTDSSGASVAGADVTVANTATGVEYRAKTNQQGLYRVSQLPPGNYSMKVENAGFAHQTFPSITLAVDQQGRQDVKLSLGSASQTVSVNASAQLIDTVSSNQGQAISNKQILDLPLNGRNFLQLPQLSAGVTPSDPPGMNSPASSWTGTQTVSVA